MPQQNSLLLANTHLPRTTCLQLPKIRVSPTPSASGNSSTAAPPRTPSQLPFRLQDLHPVGSCRAALAMQASAALVATVRLHRAILDTVHKTNEHDDPPDNEVFPRVLKGIAQVHGRAAKQAEPLSAEVLATVRATALNRHPLGDGKKQESAGRASWWARLDLPMLSVLRAGLGRRSEAAALTWGDVELRENVRSLINVRRSKPAYEAEAVTAYFGPQAGEACSAIELAKELLDGNISFFGPSPRQISRRLNAAALAAAWAKVSPNTAVTWACPRT